MARYARIVGGVVAEIIETESVAEVFHPEIAASLVETGPQTQPGWVYTGGAFSPPPSQSLPSRNELIAYVADRRWLAEQAGTLWNSFPIHTDDRSQGKYLSELQAIALGVRIDDDPWKFADGLFRPVSNAEFPQLAISAREHVRTVFGIEAVVLAEIESGAITMPAEIDAAFA
ncbi:MAG: hypothetical protein C0458_05420 [Methylobacterium sp.]|nr:hypothetical protein [Methylobacterium sp.]